MSERVLFTDSLNLHITDRRHLVRRYVLGEKTLTLLFLGNCFTQTRLFDAHLP